MLMREGQAQIQVLNSNNTWRGVRNVSPDPFYYIGELKRVKALYPDKRVRVVSSSGVLLDLII